MDTYARKFLELCGYASKLVVTDRQKARHFVQGLSTPMQKVFISYLKTFAEAVDRAR